MTHTQGQIALITGASHHVSKTKMPADARNQIAAIDRAKSQLWPTIKAKNRRTI